MFGIKASTTLLVSKSVHLRNKSNGKIRNKTNIGQPDPLVLRIKATQTIDLNDKQLKRNNNILKLKLVLTCLIIYTP